MHFFGRVCPRLSEPPIRSWEGSASILALYFHAVPSAFPLNHHGGVDGGIYSESICFLPFPAHGYNIFSARTPSTADQTDFSTADVTEKIKLKRYLTAGR